MCTYTWTPLGEFLYKETNSMACLVDYSTSNNRSGILQEIVKSEVPTGVQVAVLLLKIIDESTREKDGGEFLNIDGTKLPW